MSRKEFLNFSSTIFIFVSITPISKIFVAFDSDICASFEDLRPYYCVTERPSTQGVTLRVGSALSYHWPPLYRFTPPPIWGMVGLRLLAALKAPAKNWWFLNFKTEVYVRKIALGVEILEFFHPRRGAFMYSIFNLVANVRLITISMVVEQLPPRAGARVSIGGRNTQIFQNFWVVAPSVTREHLF